MDGRRRLVGHPVGQGSLGMFLLAISGSQHNTSHRPRALLQLTGYNPISRPCAVFVCNSERCAAAATTDTQTMDI